MLLPSSEHIQQTANVSGATAPPIQVTQFSYSTHFNDRDCHSIQESTIWSALPGYASIKESMMVPRIHIHLSAPGINHLNLTQFGLALYSRGRCGPHHVLLVDSHNVLHKKIDVIENQTHAIITQNRQDRRFGENGWLGFVGSSHSKNSTTHFLRQTGTRTCGVFLDTIVHRP